MYADDLIIIEDSLEECFRRLLIWKEGMERKGLRVNAGKTKIMICGIGLLRPVPMCDLLHWSRQKEHSMQWLQGSKEMQWAQVPERGPQLQVGTARSMDGRPQKEVHIRPDKLEVVASFCYLGDMLPVVGGCELATTTHVKTPWKKFKKLLPVLSSHHFSYKTHSHVYSSCVRNVMLHASETWPLKKARPPAFTTQ